jgi:hypothetical protein
MIGVELESLTQCLDRQRNVAVLAKNLRIRGENRPFGILLPTALELLDFAVRWHPVL